MPRSHMILSEIHSFRTGAISRSTYQSDKQQGGYFKYQFQEWVNKPVALVYFQND